MTSPAAPTYNRLNVLVGMANCFVQPWNPAVPAVLPSDLIALNGVWAAPWTAIGATDQGLSFSFQRKTTNIMIEEQQTPVQVTSDATDVMALVDLAEDSLTTMLWAFGGGTITAIAATVPQPAMNVLQIHSNLDNFAFGFEGSDPAGFYRRVLLQPVVSAGKVDAKYRRAAGKRMYQTSFTYLDKLENIMIREMVGPHL